MSGDGGRAGVFVNRVDELDAIKSALVRSGSSSCPAVIVYGEAGIGKTSLVSRFVDAFGGSGAAVLWGTCRDAEVPWPLGPWVEAVRGYVRGVSAAELGELRAAHGADLAMLVPELGDSPSGLSAAPLPDRQEARLRLFDTVVALLDRIGEGSIVVVDDAQWADASTLELLVHVARFSARADMIVVFRGTRLELEGPLARRLAEIQRIRGCRYVRLESLSRDHAGALIEEIAGRRVASDIVDALYDDSSGNPFFIAELARDLQAGAGLVTRDLPETIRGAVALRLESISQDAIELLYRACVFTDGLAFGTLRALTGLEDSALAECLDETERAGLLRVLPDGHVGFAHGLIQQALYEQLGSGRRVRLHRHAAHALEAAVDRDRPGFALELARQYHASAALAGAERGVEYALACVIDARASAAQDSVVKFLEMALDMIAPADVERRGRVLGELAVAQAEAVMHAESAATLSRALDVLEASGASPEAIADLVYCVASGLTVTFGYPGAEPIRRALALLDDRRDWRWARLKTAQRPVTIEVCGPLRVVRRPLADQEALRILEAEGPEMDYALSTWTMGLWSEGELRRRLERAQHLVDPRARLAALIGIGNRVIGTLMPLALGERVATEIETLTRELRLGRVGRIGKDIRAIVLARGGDLRSASKLLSDASERSERRPPQSFSTTPTLLEWLIEQHVDPDWEAIATGAWRIAAEMEPVQYYGLSFAALAGLGHARLGHERLARRRLAHVIPALERSQAYEGFANCALGLAAEAIEVLHDADLAARLAPIAERLITAGAGAFFMSQPDLTLARLAATQGKCADADAALARAQRALDTAGERPLRAIVDFEHAQLTAMDPGKLAMLQTTPVAFAELGMEVWSRRTAAAAPKLALRPDHLSAREVEVLRLLASGLTNRRIAEVLTLSVHTVERHVTNVYAKTGLHNRSEATAYALRHAIVGLENR
jgi:DNA-binding CsgD family transcriptional regulator